MKNIKDFYTSLNTNKSKDILDSLIKFIKKDFPYLIDNKQDINKISIIYNDYISKLTNEYIKIHSIDLNINSYVYDIIINGFENIICHYIYPLVLNIIPDYTLPNKYLFITLNNLGVYLNNINMNDLSYQLNAFINISNFTTPKYKLLLLKNLCNYINYKYADFDKVKLTKILIYLFLHCEIDNIKNQLIFCSLFRHKTVFDSEEDYYLCLALHAVDYCLKLNYKNVGMTKDEFYNKCNQHYNNDLLLLEKNNFRLNNIESLTNLPIDKLYDKYYNLDYDALTYNMFENIRNDFKIILKLIESHKK